MHALRWTLAAVVLFPAAALAEAPAEGVRVVYSRDVRPILSNRCYACHGPDENKREAELRLDDRQTAIKKAIVPNRAGASPLMERVRSADPDVRMPPPDSKKPALTPAEIDIIRRWIDQGAQFDVHWAYVPPARPEMPPAAEPGGSPHPIDRFIAVALKREGLKAMPEADRRTLIRRLSFDLTGLPPDPAEVEKFVADDSPRAYEVLVDRLLASPHYGERMAMFWLDLVRYADTGGYHSDNHRDVWAYRDYVIAAFSANLPYDQFTREQLAGDLLPQGMRQQLIASGYNRLLQTTEEGGAQGKEYTAKYAADRVRNASSVWMGTTLGCSECHNHKFDPFTSRDFYSFAAYFADIKEKAVGRQDQTRLPTPEQTAALAALDERILPLDKLMATSTPELESAQAEWEASAEAKTAPKNIADILAVAADKRSDKQRQDLAAYYRSIAPQLADTRKELAELKGQREAIDKQVLSTLVSSSGPPRTVRVLPRGNWLDDSGPVVGPAVPAALGQAPSPGKSSTRLDLAEWLVSRDNPLTARVMVNRLWMLMFGEGIVRSADDFGTQGTLPTHPELLDWLAIEFVDSGWDMKHMLRLMATSRAYRRSSIAGSENLARDPANKWLARQGRYRLEAETVRDNALAVSGLLSKTMHGPSVKPYQPAGYWQHLNFPKREWSNSQGDDQYRRGVYTYWCRSFLHPSMAAFDAPSREECTVDRPRSNTPLQALVLLNDPTYIEAARALAARMVQEGGATDEDRVQHAFRRVLQRPASADETAILVSLYRDHKSQYAAEPAAAAELSRVGDWQPPASLDAVELAAWTSVARAILNMHEAVMRN